MGRGEGDVCACVALTMPFTAVDPTSSTTIKRSSVSRVGTGTKHVGNAVPNSILSILQTCELISYAVSAGIGRERARVRVSIFIIIYKYRDE